MVLLQLINLPTQIQKTERNWAWKYIAVATGFVRRIFEHLGYDVKNLDRVMFASLTKKNIERGKWRFLNEKEVRELKYFGKGK
jgi:16S rRNA U516 pseudouridylate synthase RsuA-like enzyme